MQNGWVKIHRKLLDWEWSSTPNTCHLFIHLLLMANHEDKKWRGLVIKRGELITSLEKLSIQTGLSKQSVRTSLKHLKSTQNLTQYQHNQYTHISINNYDSYQAPNTVANTQLTHDQHTTNNKQEYKNVRNKEERGGTLNLTKNQLNKLKLQFPDTDVPMEYRKAKDWLKAEGITKKDYLPWFRNWLRREHIELPENKIKTLKERRSGDKLLRESLKRIGVDPD